MGGLLWVMNRATDQARSSPIKGSVGEELAVRVCEVVMEMIEEFGV